MLSKDTIIDKVARIFGDGDEVFAAETLVCYVENHSQTKHINLEFVRQLAWQRGRTIDGTTALRVLQYLAGDTIQLLEICFEIQDDAERFHDIPAGEVKEALESFINPLTGRSDETIAEKILFYYKPRPQVSGVLR